jgi:hypothetical protein
LPDPQRPALPGADEYGAVAVSHHGSRAERRAVAIVGVGVEHVDRLTGQLGAHAERGRPDAPGDVLRVVLPAERERGLAQRRPEPAVHLVPEAGQRHADVARVDAHAVEHLAGAGERGRRHLLGIELADGDVGRHRELAPRPDVAQVEVARLDRRLGPHHR